MVGEFNGGVGAGIISGDPHVKITIPGQEPICFDFHSNHLSSEIMLIQDTLNGVNITGELSTDLTNKNRLIGINVATKSGDRVQITSNDLVIQDEKYDFSQQKIYGLKNLK